jgi:hypothetical protein
MIYIDKRTNSPAYRRKLKKFTEAIKSYRGLTKIPGQPPKLKSSASPRELADYNDKNQFRVDRSTIRYFLFAMEGSNAERRPAKTEETPAAA